ncbi:protein ARABIDILLO 1-like isoform X2 [Hibiscus syriacus]|uniref:protein ARABIDILLO 1-like isoform X1 n=1 Tax=Hibiscus syriacus TaxID=106335 RepID=UPI00192120D2|nr:protein ARABIDILLO 1-like isoform X1 [Hibiscus syriacus]XP_038992315.1 protein ARABIDILLO 1-like isoform X2 [Hibiscus syriacus]
MNQRVRQKRECSQEKDKTNTSSKTLKCNRLTSATISGVDWTTLPDDTVIQLFSYLNYRDRASLASTCQTFRLLGSFPCLWGSLDLRSHKFDTAAAVSLSSRCKNLQRLKFHAAGSADAIVSLQARELREISGDFCRDITDAALSVIAARHEMLESVHLGPDACERISCDAIKALAYCCPRLQRLWMSGVKDINGDAINALAKHCRLLKDVGFVESDNIDEVALGNLSTVKFLSVAGSRNLKWGSAAHGWSRLPCLVCLDVSRTDVNLTAVTGFLSMSQNLKVLSALNCPVFEGEVDRNSMYNHKGKILLTFLSDMFKGVTSLFANNSKNVTDVFRYWRRLVNRDKNVDEIVVWIECVFSHSLLRIAENNLKEFDDFWLTQGAAILLSLLRSSKEEVQERAAMAVATFVVIDDENATVDCKRAEAILRGDGIRVLLNLARSCQEGLQSEAAKAIANLSIDSKVAKAVAESGGIKILANLAKSMNRLVAEEAAGGLWNLSVGDDHKGAIAKAGGIKALVDLIFKWPSSTEGLLERATGALANLGADEKCSLEVAVAGGIHALVMLARTCKFDGVQEQAARALANLAAHGDSNSNNADIGQEEGALEALVQLTYSQNEGVRQEAAGALWNLSFDDKNREAIAAAGGVEALVALAQSSSSSSRGLQERAAGALWGLSVSETNSIAIGRQGGIAPLIALARSDIEDVHETAAGALWNLAFYRENALHIVHDGGVKPLIHLCSSSVSKMARFMAALALVYIFDGRIDTSVPAGSSSSGSSKTLNTDGVGRIALKHVEEFVTSFYDPQSFLTAASSLVPTALAQIAEAIRIQEAGHLRCSGAEIDRFLRMLRDPSSILKSCSAFALLQFTLPGGRHAMHHSSLLQNAGAPRVLRGVAAASTTPIQAKIYAKIVLRNLERHHELSSYL